jgi:ABC-type dipeptide/oligopeptide/nickel transport system permease component
VARYAFRRCAWMLATLVLVSVINFLVIFLLPINPLDAIAGDKATPAVMAAIEKYYGLDRPVYVQYGLYVWHALHGDFGVSYQTSQPVGAEIAQRFPATAELAAAAFLLTLALGLGAGLAAGVRPGGAVDGALTVSSLFFNSLPTFWLGTVLLYVFGFKLQVLPLGGYGGGGHLRYLVLPAMTLALTEQALYARLLRAQLFEVRHEDYVRTAWAKGLSRRLVYLRHVVRNALLPVVSFAGVNLANLLSGLILIETVFGWPGLGLLTYQSLTSFDVPVIMGTALLSAVLVVLANLAVDLVYMLLDPRVSYG